MINADDMQSWAYLFSPIFQVVNTAGKPLTEGWIEVYIHGTRDKYYCASDFDGTLQPFQIPLDSLGSNIVLADPSQSYDVYIYNKFGSLIMSRYNVSPSSGEGGTSTNIVIKSEDGTVSVNSDSAGTFDLSIQDTVDRVSELEDIVGNIETNVAPAYAIGHADTVNPDHTINLINDAVTGIDYLQDMTGYRLKSGHVYQFNFNAKFDCGENNQYCDGKFYIEGDSSIAQEWKFTLDDSYEHSESVNGSTVLVTPSNLEYYDIKLKYAWNEDYTNKPDIDLNKISIVDVTSIILGKEIDSNYSAGSGILIDEDNVISVDMDYINSHLDIDATEIVASAVNIATAYTNTVSGNIINYVDSASGNIVNYVDESIVSAISVATGAQVQSDWTETDDTDPSYIQNKPNELEIVAGQNIGIFADNSTITIAASATDLSDYATHSELNNVSGVLHNEISSTSAICKDEIESVSGTLHNEIVSVSGTLHNEIGSVSASIRTYTSPSGTSYINNNNNTIEQSNRALRTTTIKDWRPIHQLPGDRNVSVSFECYSSSVKFDSTSMPEATVVLSYGGDSFTYDLREVEDQELFLPESWVGKQISCNYTITTPSQYQVTIYWRTGSEITTTIVDDLAWASDLDGLATEAQVYNATVTAIQTATAAIPSLSGYATLANVSSVSSILQSEIEAITGTIPTDYVTHNEVSAVSGNIVNYVNEVSGNIVEVISEVSGVDNNFMAVYGSTTFNEISTARSEGKEVYCAYNDGRGRIFYAQLATEGYGNITFSTTYNDSVYYYVVTAGDAWSTTSTQIPVSQVQSNWTETNTSSASYIQNKPEESTLIAGSGINISASGTDFIISSTVTGGSTYNAGSGINIVNDTISVDTTLIPTISAVSAMVDAASANDNLFIAKQGVTTNGELNNAINSNKCIILNAYSAMCIMTRLDSTSHNIYFATLSSTTDTQFGRRYPNQIMIFEVPNYHINPNRIITLNLYKSSLQADWNQTNSYYADYIKNKPDLSVYTTQVQVSAIASAYASGGGGSGVNYEAGDHIDITDNTISVTGITELVAGHSITITASGASAIISSTGEAQVQSDWDEWDSSKPSYIRNKPSIPQDPVQSDWNETDPDSLAYIKNKPNITDAYTGASGIAIDNSVISLDEPLGIVAGSGINIVIEGDSAIICVSGVTGGGTQVNADWTATSGVAEILNKPTESNLLAGSGISFAASGNDYVINAVIPTVTLADLNTAGITDIQLVTAMPQSPVSSILYLIPEA